MTYFLKFVNCPIQSGREMSWLPQSRSLSKSGERRLEKPFQERSSLRARPGLLRLQGRLQVLPKRLPLVRNPVNLHFVIRKRSVKEEYNVRKRMMESNRLHERTMMQYVPTVLFVAHRRQFRQWSSRVKEDFLFFQTLEVVRRALFLIRVAVMSPSLLLSSASIGAAERGKRETLNGQLLKISKTHRALLVPGFLIVLVC